MSLAEVKERVTELSPQERADLQAFMQSLDEEILSPEWLNEVSQRQKDFDSGQIRFLSHNQVFSQTRAKK